MNTFNRVMIVGNNGSGKSYFATQLAELTGLPLVHLDKLFWKPGWEMPTTVEWEAVNRQLVLQNKWIIDGNVNHGGTMDIRFAAADLVIFLDVSRLICLVSVFMRRGRRFGFPDYLNEKIDRGFWKLLWNLWTYPKTRGRMILELKKNHPDKLFCVIKGRRQANRFLRELNTLPSPQKNCKKP